MSPHLPQFRQRAVRLARSGDVSIPRVARDFGMATIKKDCVHRHRFKTRDEARFAIFDYIEGFYNPRRRHSALGHKRPLVFEQIHATLASAKVSAA